MIIRKVTCDICGNEIFKGRVNEEELNKPIRDNYKIQIGNKVIVEDCCYDCAIEQKNYIKKLKNIFNERSFSND